MHLPVLLLAALAAGSGGGNLAPPPPWHAIAFVNDARSHGQLGDGLLSLNEVIQLHNQTIGLGQLSPAELAQISGVGDLFWADIDSAVTPIVTIERDLDVIVDSLHGFRIAGYGATRPVLDFSGAGVQHGIRAASNFCSFVDLVLQGGPYGIHLTQTDSTSGCIVRGVEFRQHAQWGLRVHQTTANGRGRVVLDDCAFVGLPIAMIVDESAANRSSFFAAWRVALQGVTTGLDAALGPGGAANYWLNLWQGSATDACVRIARPGGSNRALTLTATQIAGTATTAFEVTGSTTADTTLELRMLDLASPAQSGCALRLAPLGGRFRGVIEDSTLAGNVEVLTGGASSDLSLYNLRLAPGAATFGSAGTQALSLIECRFDGVAVQSTGQRPIDVTECCLLGGSISGTATAPWSLSRTFLSCTLGAHVQESAPRPAAQLGSFSLQPVPVTLGSTLTLQADLPAGLWAVFGFGLTDETPDIQPRPIHVYFDTTAWTLLPGVYRLQQAASFAIPNNPLLLGLDCTAQMAVSPDAGVGAPPLSLPPGKRFVLR